MNLEDAKTDIAEYDRKLRLIEIELMRMEKMRAKFQAGRDKIQAFIELYPQYSVPTDEVT